MTDNLIVGVYDLMLASESVIEEPLRRWSHLSKIFSWEALILIPIPFIVDRRRQSPVFNPYGNNPKKRLISTRGGRRYFCNGGNVKPSLRESKGLCGRICRGSLSFPFFGKIKDFLHGSHLIYKNKDKRVKMAMTLKVSFFPNYLSRKGQTSLHEWDPHSKHQGLPSF